jgi:hypothetical protein
MAGEPNDPQNPPNVPFIPPGFPFALGYPFPFVPPDLWLQMWLPLTLAYYREFLQSYKMMIEGWNSEKVDESLRVMANELLRTGLAAREIRSKLAKIQIESIDNYLKVLDRLAGSGGAPNP